VFDLKEVLSFKSKSIAYKLEPWQQKHHKPTTPLIDVKYSNHVILQTLYSGLIMHRYKINLAYGNNKHTLLEIFNVNKC
jgi:hypothetical protein